MTHVFVCINAINRPPQRARAHKLLNKEVHVHVSVVSGGSRARQHFCFLFHMCSRVQASLGA